MQIPSTVSAIASLLVAVAACSSGRHDVRRLLRADDDRRGRAFIELLAEGRVDSATNRLATSLRTAESRKQLADVSLLLSTQKADSIRIVDANIVKLPSGPRVNLSYQIYARRSWLLATVVLADSGNDWVVAAIAVQPLDRPLEETVDFTLRRRSALEYAWLFLTVGCGAFSICTAVFVATRRSLPRRWLLVGTSLVGVGAFRLNWATGDVNFVLLNVQLLPSAFNRAGPFAPWIVTFAFPFGAVIALRSYRSWKRQSRPTA